MDPVIVVENVQSVSVTVQNELAELYRKLREAEGLWYFYPLDLDSVFLFISICLFLSIVI